MSFEVELNLKIPSLTIRAPGEPAARIDNGSVRFSKRLTVATLPKAGASLSVSTRDGEPFDCTVTRSDWHDGKNLFVVSCNHGRRSITSAEHAALLSDPDWATTQLP